MIKCAECGKFHPEDKIIDAFGWCWDDIQGFSEHEDWPLASKLAKALIEVGNVCEYQFNRAEFLSRSQTPPPQGQV